MSRLDTLRATAETHERRGAKLAAAVAAELMRPTAERTPVAEALAELRHLQGLTDHLMVRLRAGLGVARDKGLRVAALHPSDARYEKVMRARLRHWGAVVEAAMHCDRREEWPLVPPPRARFDLGAAEEAVMSRVFTRAHSAINPVPQGDEAVGLGCFADIPLNVGRFLMNAHLAYRVLLARKDPRPFRFLDVGCGGGVKVALAAELFDIAEGLEYDAGYVGVAQRTLAAMRALHSAVLHADGLTFDGYGDYQVIYFFQPMSDVDALHRLEERIVTEARPGTVLIAPYHNYLDRARQLGCGRIRENVFVVGLDEAGADALAAEVARIGPDIANPDSRIPAEAGWLRPLWLACQANGICPG